MKKYSVKIKFEARGDRHAVQIVADMLSEIDYDEGNQIEHSIRELKK